MRHFRRLPPFLRLVSILGILFWLAALVVASGMLMAAITNWEPSQPLMDYLHMVGAVRMCGIGLNLVVLGQACAIVIYAYSRRYRQPDGGTTLLESWQSQMLAVALLAALPLCAITLVAVIPPTQGPFGLAFIVSMLAWLEQPVAYLWALSKTSPALLGTPRT